MSLLSVRNKRSKRKSRSRRWPRAVSCTRGYEGGDIRKRCVWGHRAERATSFSLCTALANGNLLHNPDASAPNTWTTPTAAPATPSATLYSAEHTIIYISYKNCHCTSHNHTHLSSSLLVEVEELAQFVLAGCAGFVDFVAQYEHGTVAERLVGEERVELVLGLYQPRSVAGVHKEHDRVHGGEVVAPNTPRLLMPAEVEGREPHAPYRQLFWCCKLCDSFI